MANQIVVSSGAKVRNLEGVLTGTSGVVSSVPYGGANGVATLDAGGKVPVSQLPSSVVTYLGTWNAATNTPTLVNGTGDAGDLYLCNVAGTVNFGAGPITFAIGDWVLYGSGTWQKSNGQNGTVTSVAASITGNSLGITGSPITTAGTLAFAFAGTNLQYVNGAGDLTTFPSLTGYIPYTGATSSIDLNNQSVVNISHLGINTTSVPTILLRAVGDNNTSSRIAMRGYSSNANSSSIRVTKFRGTAGAPQAPLSGDSLGKFELAGYGTTSSDGYPQASFEGIATENWGATARGSKTVFKITPNTTITQAIALTINQDKSAVFENSVTGTSIIKTGGTSSQFLKADGSVDSTSYITLSSLSFAAGSGAYNNTTGVITIPTNNNQITNGAGYITSSALTGYVPYTGATTNVDLGSNSISSSFIYGNGASGIAGAIYLKQTTSVQDSSSGYSSISAFGGYSLHCSLNNGTLNRRFRLNAFNLDGTNIRTYTLPDADGTIALVGGAGVGTVTSVAALTLGTSGTDLSSSVANSTTTPVITLNVPTASAANRGALSSADWTTFNNKASTASLANYLLLTGGTLTGQLYINPTNTATVGLDVASNTTRFRSDNLEGFKRQLEITMGSGTLVQMVAKGFGANYGTDLSFYSSAASGVNASPAIYITGTNNRVGIKTGSPAYDLDVSGTGRFTSAVTIGTDFAQLLPISASNYQLLVGNYYDGTNIIATATAGSRTVYNVGGMDFRTFTGATVGSTVADTSRMTISSAGDVGIGAAPTSFGSSYTVLDVYNGTVGGYILARSPNVTGQISVDNNTAMSVQTRTNHPITFNVNNAEKMRITTGGSVCINSTRATAALVIDANLNALTGIDMRDLGTTGGAYIFFQNSSGNQSGIITHVGTTAVLYTSTSDYRLKENVETLKNGLDRILNLKPVTYTWIDTNNEEGEGFLAHELQEVVPLAVFGQKDELKEDGSIKPQSIDNSRIVPILVKAIQEQQAQITSLQARLDKAGL